MLITLLSNLVYNFYFDLPDIKLAIQEECHVASSKIAKAHAIKLAKPGHILQRLLQRDNGLSRPCTLSITKAGNEPVPRTRHYYRSCVPEVVCNGQNLNALSQHFFLRVDKRR